MADPHREACAIDLMDAEAHKAGIPMYSQLRAELSRLQVAGWHLAAWGVFDQRGLYDWFSNEQRANDAAATWNVTGAESLKPFSVRPLYTAAQTDAAPATHLQCELSMQEGLPSGDYSPRAYHVSRIPPDANGNTVEFTRQPTVVNTAKQAEAPVLGNRTVVMRGHDVRLTRVDISPLGGVGTPHPESTVIVSLPDGVELGGFGCLIQFRPDATELTDRKIAEIAEDLGLIGPRSRVGNLHSVVGPFARAVEAEVRAMLLAEQGEQPEASPAGAQSPTLRIRHHRGGLEESLATTSTIPATIAAVAQFVQADPSSVTVEKYGAGVDDRCGWDTHVVSVDGRACAFTDGPVTTQSEAPELTKGHAYVWLIDALSGKVSDDAAMAVKQLVSDYHFATKEWRLARTALDAQQAEGGKRVGAEGSSFITDDMLNAASDFIFADMGSPSDWAGFDKDGLRSAMVAAAPALVPLTDVIHQCSRCGHDRKKGCPEGHANSARCGFITHVQATGNEWTRGYYCAVSAALREEGLVTPLVRSLYDQGGNPQYADQEDREHFASHGLTVGDGGA